MPLRLPRLRPIVLASDRLLWAVRVRWLVVIGFFGLAAAARLLGWLPSLRSCAIAALTGLALNSVNQYCVRRDRWVRRVTAVAIPCDHILITYVVVHTGGIVSPFLMMYFVQVVTTAMLVDTRVAVASAAVAVIAWISGVRLAATAELAAYGIAEPDAVLKTLWAAFLVYCLGLLVYVGGYIGQRLRSSEEDLAEKNLRLEAALAAARSAYDKLKQAEGQLVHSEKMRSLGQLVAGVAHELNNPISFITANVDHLRAYTERLTAAVRAYAAADLPAAARERFEALRAELRIDRVIADLPGLLDDCEEGARRSKQIVAELRTFSRNDEVDQWRTTDLARGLDTTISLLAHRLRQIEIHREYARGVDVQCLPGPLNQVFMNLIANAADAIGDRRGNIWIAIEAAGGDLPDETVRVSVRDDGVGMAPEVAARVFEPFFTTKDVGQGTGLGLAVSYAIIERHRGRIAIESQPGVGTAVVLTLPLRQAAERADAAEVETRRAEMFVDSAGPCR